MHDHTERELVQPHCSFGRRMNILLGVVFFAITYNDKAESTKISWEKPPLITGTSGSGTFSKAFPENTTANSTIDDLAFRSSTTNATYAIVSQEVSGQFTVDTVTGDIKLAAGKTVNYEIKNKYYIVVNATSENDTGTANGTINISDVNDPPVFTSSQLAVTIPDGSAAGTTLTTCLATDEDVPAQKITYSITAAGNTNSMFSIVGSTGVITVATNKTIAASTIAGYSLIVEAADNGTSAATGTATVWVVVKTSGSGAVAITASCILLIAVFVALMVNVSSTINTFTNR